VRTIKKISILIIFLALVKMANSQPVTVNFIHKQEKISTLMTGLSDSHLLTLADSINLDKILSLYFSETLPDSLTLVKLYNLDIYVYLKDKRYKVKIKDNQPEFNSTVSVGFGFGLDYGGIGLKVSLFPAKPIGAFVGIGNNTLEPAFNVGIDWKFKYMKRTSGFLACMYGYNAITDINTGVGNDHNTYYGLSAQVGARMRVWKMKNYLSLGAIVPITQDSKIKELKKLYGDDLDYAPVLLSIGFHFGL
jgi:hypothetical protein